VDRRRKIIKELRLKKPSTCSKCRGEFGACECLQGMARGDDEAVLRLDENQLHLRNEALKLIEAYEHKDMMKAGMKYHAVAIAITRLLADSSFNGEEEMKRVSVEYTKYIKQLAIEMSDAIRCQFIFGKNDQPLSSSSTSYNIYSVFNDDQRGKKL